MQGTTNTPIASSSNTGKIKICDYRNSMPYLKNNNKQCTSNSS